MTSHVGRDGKGREGGSRCRGPGCGGGREVVFSAFKRKCLI